MKIKNLKYLLVGSLLVFGMMAVDCMAQVNIAGYSQISSSGGPSGPANSNLTNGSLGDAAVIDGKNPGYFKLVLNRSYKISKIKIFWSSGQTVTSYNIEGGAAWTTISGSAVNGEAITEHTIANISTDFVQVNIYSNSTYVAIREIEIYTNETAFSDIIVTGGSSFLGPKHYFNGQISAGTVSASTFIGSGTQLTGIGKWGVNGSKIYFNTGNVGIGTNNPSTQLELRDGSGLLIQASNAQISFADVSSTVKLRMDNSGNLHVNDVNNIPFVKFQPSAVNKLSVCGTIRANAVVVNLEGCDFVFEEDYKLMSLNDLEMFINEHNHLPEISSANEMEKDGVELGDLNSKLLQKIEELTLYVIDQNKKIELLEEQVRGLK